MKLLPAQTCFVVE